MLAICCSRSWLLELLPAVFVQEEYWSSETGALWNSYNKGGKHQSHVSCLEHSRTTQVTGKPNVKNTSHISYLIIFDISPILWHDFLTKSSRVSCQHSARSISCFSILYSFQFHCKNNQNWILIWQAGIAQNSSLQFCWRSQNIVGRCPLIKRLLLGSSLTFLSHLEMDPRCLSPVPADSPKLLDVYSYIHGRSSAQHVLVNILTTAGSRVQ